MLVRMQSQWLASSSQPGGEVTPEFFNSIVGFRERCGPLPLTKQNEWVPVLTNLSCNDFLNLLGEDEFRERTAGYG